MMVYMGTIPERMRMRSSFSISWIIVTSYDILRQDIEYLKGLQFRYCVLDEGHLIRNAQTATANMVKQIIAKHRLILTGTPVQNDVFDIWSLFDFLMPGYLGTLSQFKAFCKPIKSSLESKNRKHQEQGNSSTLRKKNCWLKRKNGCVLGVVTLQKLQKKILPFILRRTKNEVLQDLPPKIVQDYPCQMSEVQRVLYDHFIASVSRLRGILV